jgi:hypothetical protein
MDNFVELHRNALAITTKMLANLGDAQQKFVEGAVIGGGRLVMELGPLPDAQRVAIVLIEREGRRFEVCSMNTTGATLQ